MLSVKYKNRAYQADINLRDNLFKLLKDTNPDFEVEILSNETGEKLRVCIKNLVLYTAIRSL